MDLTSKSFILTILFTVVSTQESCNRVSPCMPITQCKGLYELLTVTPKFSNISSLVKPLLCNKKNRMIYVCCPPDLMEVKYRPSPLPNTKVCGISTEDRIYGGNLTDLGEHPWLGLLRYEKPNDWGFHCAGALISSEFILTAAHCLKGAEIPITWRLSQVRLGDWNISSSRDCISTGNGVRQCSPPAIDVKIKEQIVHEKFDPFDQHQQYDIALLRLERKVDFTDYISPICIPLTEDQRTKLHTVEDMTVAGWGQTERRTKSDVKLKVTVPVVSRISCANVYKKAERNITDKQLCAGGEKGKDSCRGDSGSPLVAQLPGSQNWFITGVVSYGPTPCGTSGWPGVYTRVGSFVDWIESKVRGT